MSAPRTQGPVDPVARAVERGAAALIARQRADGAWQGANDAGPLFTGASLALEAAIGSLRPEDAQDGVRALRAAILPDGRFERWPGSGEGGHEATCFGYAGLHASGVPAADPDMLRLRTAIEAGGGLRRNLLVVRAVLAAAGVVDARSLPPVPVLQTLLPGYDTLLGHLFGVNALVPLHVVPPLISGLRRGARPVGALGARVSRRVVAYLSERQDTSGGFAGVPFYTLLMALVLRLHGVPLDDARVVRAVAYARSTYVRGGSGLWAGVFHCQLWDTAHSLRVLAGLPGAAGATDRAVAALADAQSLEPSPPDWQTPPPGGARVGGWSFQSGNRKNPDIDSTAVVLGALTAPGVPASAARDRAFALGADWLLSMQNPDGGFAAFSHGKRAAPPGALYLPTPPERGLRGLGLRLDRLLAELGDPSTADVTGRVLQGLGARLQVGDVRVDRAVAFLRRHQLGHGGFWGRWAVNHLPATSYIVTGLRAVGLPPEDPMIRGAVRFLLACQNDDGGFGETPESYVHADAAGRGPSTVQVTGVVLWALCAAGARDTEAVQRAVRFLLERQAPDGSWDDASVYGVIFPHRYYYRSDLFPTHLALEGLRAARPEPAP